jgi:protein disulfide-isomerase
MKVSWFGWSLLSLLAVPTLAAPSESETKVGNRLEKRRNNRGIDAEEPSIFNGLDVPPLLQLTPDNYEELLKDGTWSVPFGFTEHH